jgi:hypothetical protein
MVDRDRYDLKRMIDRFEFVEELIYKKHILHRNASQFLQQTVEEFSLEFSVQIDSLVVQNSLYLSIHAMLHYQSNNQLVNVYDSDWISSKTFKKRVF